MKTLNVARKALQQSTELDSYLVSIASQHPSHNFLGGATQGCYLRQINFIRLLFETRGRTPDTVKVLDWGSGKGHISYLLRKAGFDVQSCDLFTHSNDSSFGQLTPIIHEQKINVAPLHHSAMLPFQDNSFDLVVSFGVLEHVESDRASMREIQRVLKNQGVFFIAFLPYWLSWTQNVAHHLLGDFYHPHLYKRSKLKRLAVETGFTVEGIWHGQLLPKNSFRHHNLVERIDRFLTNYTPLKYLATNLEGVLVARK